MSGVARTAEAGGARPTGAAAWSIEDLALLLQGAVSDHNDVDGVSWRGVARDVAEALGLALYDAPQAAMEAR